MPTFDLRLFKQPIDVTATPQSKSVVERLPIGTQKLIETNRRILEEMHGAGQDLDQFGQRLFRQYEIEEEKKARTDNLDNNVKANRIIHDVQKKYDAKAEEMRSAGIKEYSTYSNAIEQLGEEALSEAKNASAGEKKAVQNFVESRMMSYVHEGGVRERHFAKEQWTSGKIADLQEFGEIITRRIAANPDPAYQREQLNDYRALLDSARDVVPPAQLERIYRHTEKSAQMEIGRQTIVAIAKAGHPDAAEKVHAFLEDAANGYTTEEKLYFEGLHRSITNEAWETKRQQEATAEKAERKRMAIATADWDNRLNKAIEDGRYGDAEKLRQEGDARVKSGELDPERVASSTRFLANEVQTAKRQAAADARREPADDKATVAALMASRYDPSRYNPTKIINAYLKGELIGSTMRYMIGDYDAVHGGKDVLGMPAVKSETAILEKRFEVVDKFVQAEAGPGGLFRNKDIEAAASFGHEAIARYKTRVLEYATSVNHDPEKVAKKAQEFRLQAEHETEGALKDFQDGNVPKPRTLHASPEEFARAFERGDMTFEEAKRQAHWWKKKLGNDIFKGKIADQNMETLLK